jgi:hypothetical protein
MYSIFCSYINDFYMARIATLHATAYLPETQDLVNPAL